MNETWLPWSKYYCISGPSTNVCVFGWIFELALQTQFYLLRKTCSPFASLHIKRNVTCSTICLIYLIFMLGKYAPDVVVGIPIHLLIFCVDLLILLSVGLYDIPHGLVCSNDSVPSERLATVSDCVDWQKVNLNTRSRARTMEVQFKFLIKQAHSSALAWFRIGTISFAQPPSLGTKALFAETVWSCFKIPPSPPISWDRVSASEFAYLCRDLWGESFLPLLPVCKNCDAKINLLTGRLSLSWLAYSPPGRMARKSKHREEP